MSHVAVVLPDVSGLDRTFDYLVPDPMRDHVVVGTLVRVELHGRRVGGWVVALHEQASSARPLKPIAKVTGIGPTADVVELGEWAAWRWAGRHAALLRAASPPVAVRGLPNVPPPSPPAAAAQPVDVAREVFAGAAAVVRLPPAADTFPMVWEAAAHTDALVLAPSTGAAVRLAGRLRRAGRRVALLPRDWAAAAAGGCVAVGARAAAWAPRPHLGGVLVLDEHDEAYQEERAPTWHARDVALERARRAGVPCVLTSPCPSLEALSAASLLTASRHDERSGWPVVEVIDRRGDDPRTGLYSSRLVALLRERPRVVCVLNRKGRARLLACATCGELARCERCDAAVEQSGESAILTCRRCDAERPLVCLACGATRLRVLRAGVTRVREELERLAGRPVIEVTGDAGEVGDGDVLVGTEAVLHRVETADVVAFLDLDQELLAPRYRAAEQAFALLVRGARLVGGRDGGGRLLLQTRLPHHEAIDAAVHADPSRLAVVEAARRAMLRFPPEAALAQLSGASADAYAHELERDERLELLGPAGGDWLVRAPSHGPLCDALAAAPRPPGRLRVAVDPLRV